MKPLAGVSYLTTSPTYYEMMARLKKDKQSTTKSQQVRKSTRRMLTENKITSNIMQFNQQSPVRDFSDMQVSLKYQTAVSHSKYQLREDYDYSGLSIQDNTPIPLHFLLGTDLKQLSEEYFGRSEIYNQCQDYNTEA